MSGNLPDLSITPVWVKTVARLGFAFSCPESSSLETKNTVQDVMLDIVSGTVFSRDRVQTQKGKSNDRPASRAVVWGGSGWVSGVVAGAG
jgi:hypothetical protein